MKLSYLYRKFLYTATRFPGRNIRVKALRKLGFTIGKDVYIGPRLTMAVGISDKSMKLTIGDRVSFGPNVTLILATHPNNSRLNQILKFPPRQIEIGDDSWLGANVVVMPNVKIGKACIIGAGAVVTKNIPDFSIAAGVPAKVIKTIDKDAYEDIN
jgi:acetyltransferase-like isoleucine patch superfamily enzyme